MIQRMLANWSLVPLPFLNPTCTSGSSQFMYCWSLIWRILSITFVSVWDECNCVVVWTFFGIAFLWDWNENWPFPVLWPLLSFPDLLAYWVQHFHSWRMDKQNTVYPGNRILFSLKSEHRTDTFHRMNTAWKRDAKGKKPDTKRPCLHELICMKSRKQSNPLREKLDQGSQEHRGGKMEWGLSCHWSLVSDIGQWWWTSEHTKNC